MTPTTTIRAHAKLTRTLHVTGTRPDGYHLIDAEMVSLELHDVLTIDADGDGIAATGPYAAGVPLDATNLVARALARHSRHAHVTIDKQIPHGGGLGGGSSDAAATLAWCGVGTSPDELADAASLGADIAFCLVGGRAAVGGIGEVVSPLPHLDLAVTLIVPPLVVATPAVYRAFDELGSTDRERGALNHLEAAAIMVEPRLGDWRDRIRERCGVAPTLAGSGATWFVEHTTGDGAAAHDDALSELVGEGAQVIRTRTVPAAIAAPRP